ncbi:MAG: sigma-70 family RNA polymerase sigma factor [Deltaproteobacteria bacterium]|nr:sigma-70 family RNA polymerase sigma factor [Deltaproteobacteria bacterium]
MEKYTTQPEQEQEAQLSERAREFDIACACANGDREAQRQLINSVFDAVTATVSYALNTHVFAQDVIQESLVEILNSMRYFRGECSLTTWSRRISMRVAYKRLKKFRKYQKQLQSYTPDDAIEPQGELAVGSKELRLQINSAISSLPIKQQQVIRLKYIHEHSIQEIAQIVDAPQETVRDRLKVGKKKLKRLLSKNPALSDWIKKGE